MKLYLLLWGVTFPAQNPREIVSRSVEAYQLDWMQMTHYTWVARLTDRHLDNQGNVKSEEKQAWETIVVDGEPCRRILERAGRPLSPDEQKKQQENLDRTVAKLERESPGQRARRMEKEEKERTEDRRFLLEIADLYDFRLVGDANIDGRDVWVIDATPKPGYQPRHSDAKPLLKIRGRIWIDKIEYQWVRLEAETTGTISYGVFLARLNPGAKLVFEQQRVNDQVWLPKREFTRGSGRVGLLKKIQMEEELTWNNYRKFEVESKIVK
jgi:hypothetical protein